MTRMAVLWVCLHCFRKGLLPLAGASVGERSDAMRALAALDAAGPRCNGS